jgi:hypothetical protein
MTDDTADMQAIQKMLIVARKESVLVEVVWSYGYYIKSGNSASEACRCALYDWDC